MSTPEDTAATEAATGIPEGRDKGVEAATSEDQPATLSGGVEKADVVHGKNTIIGSATGTTSTTTNTDTAASTGTPTISKASLPSSPSSPSSSKFGKISWGICDRLRCESCGHTASAPVHQCRSGHVLCSPCGNKLLTCPNKNCEVSVRSDLPLSINASVASIADAAGVTVPCRSKNCDWRVRHADLARHEKNCFLIRKGIVSPTASSVSDDDKGEESANEILPPDELATESIRDALNCSLCNHVAPAPIMQCRNGHVVCYHCLGRLRKFDDPICPRCSIALDPSDENNGTVVRNLHLEELATFAKISVPCRHEGCEVQLAHSDLAAHLEVCEHQPIKCVHCTVKGIKDVALTSWDAMWDHYREEHLPTFPPTSLDKMMVDANRIESLQNMTFGFLTWNHCVDPATGDAVDVFPGVLYHKPMDAFYFSVRVMGPLDPNVSYRLKVEPSGFERINAGPEACVTASMPPTSYRVGYLDDATLATAARMIRKGPCLVLSGPTVMHMLKVSADGGEDDCDGSLCFSVALGE